MAEEADDESKTEDPSPRRREEARKQGRVPFSAELVGALVLLAGVVGLGALGPGLGAALTESFRAEVPRAYRPELTPDGVQEDVGRVAARPLVALAPLFGLLLAVGAAAGAAQVGLVVNTERLGPDLTKLDPAAGAGRLFSTAALVKGGLAVLKVAALGWVVYLVIGGRAGAVVGLTRDTPAGAAGTAWRLVVRLATYLSAAVAVVAVLDYLYQRVRFERGLRMTKQEVKDELKQEEGDPQIKARIRQIARDRARQKMLKEVPKATVVVTNPEHYAVALRYEAGRDAAPVVVAKGAGAFARRVAAVAREAGVPVLERPALARALHAGVREGQPIPGPLFQAVAEVLAFLYRMRGVAGG